MFQFKLARVLGMTVQEMEERMSSMEFTEWAAFFRIEAEEGGAESLEDRVNRLVSGR